MARARDRDSRLRRHGSGPTARRDPVSHLGLAVQALGFGLGFAIPRPSDVPLSLGETLLCWLGVPLAWGSAWIAFQAVRVLGRHWSLEARLLPGHRLVREGPYAWVRHPIYAAMLGLFVGTGVSLTPLPVLLVAVGVYLLGTRLRTRSGGGCCGASSERERGTCALRSKVRLSFWRPDR